MFLYKLNKGDYDMIILNNEKVTRLLNEWYKVILSKQITKATRMKEEVDEKISVLMVEQKSRFTSIKISYCTIPY